jgi:dsRNA-specific ribonuclease
MTDQIQIQGIYLGSRGDDFKNLIKSVLKKGNLKNRYIEMLTDDESMKVYGDAFTSDLVDPVNNYQVLEMVGDLIGNKFIVNYMYQRFPQLNCSEGVKVVARLRINYGAKQSFSDIARKLGFWDFISATNDLRQRKMKPLLEDVFEAFLGATERIIDQRKRIGVGYAIVYDILASIFDDMDISLRYEDLYDSKTRLKELFDMYESSLGPLVYKEEKTDLIQCSTVYRVEGGQYQQKADGSFNKKRIIGGVYIKIGEGSASLKADAQQNAATMALENLAKQGWKKQIPLVYQNFNSGNDIKNKILDKQDIIDRWGDDLNSLQSTREKNKYQNKYQSTPLCKYCRERNLSGVKACLELGADINIPDSDGMFAIDLLFIGKVEEKVVEEIMVLLMNKNNYFKKIHRMIFDMYYKEYLGKYFSKVIDKFDIVE